MTPLAQRVVPSTRLPTVDVDVPCYRYGHFLDDCVASILGQEDVLVRALIVDDASPDCTPGVAARLAAGDDRVLYLRNERNLGHIRTYNKGLAACTADYCLLLSADDILAPGALSRAVRVFERNPDVVLVYGRQLAFTSAPPVSVMAGAPDETVLESRGFVERAARAADNPVPTPTALVRTAIQHRVGGYSDHLPHTADLEMWLRLASCGRVGVLSSVQAFKRAHGSNMSLDFIAAADRELRQRKAAFDTYFAGERRWPSLAAEVDRRLAIHALVAANQALESGDLDRFRSLKQLARDIRPAVVRCPYWAKLHVKSLIGAKCTAAARTLLGLFQLGSQREAGI